jgi:hypothetical protein
MEQEKKTTYKGKELSWKNGDADFEKAIKTSFNVIESAQTDEVYLDSNMKRTNQI